MSHEEDLRRGALATPERIGNSDVPGTGVLLCQKPGRTCVLMPIFSIVYNPYLEILFYVRLLSPPPEWIGGILNVCTPICQISSVGLFIYAAAPAALAHNGMSYFLLCRRSIKCPTIIFQRKSGGLTQQVVMPKMENQNLQILCQFHFTELKCPQAQESI